MKKRGVIVFLGCVIIINLLFLGMNIKNEDENIKETIEQYFKLKYISLSKLEFQKELNDIYYRDNNKVNALDLLEIDINWRKGQELDYRFSDYNYEVEYIKLNYRSNYASLKLKENHKIRYNCIGSKYSILNNLIHDIKLKKEKDSKWYIIDDLYESDVLNEFGEYRYNEKSEFKKKYELKEAKHINKSIKIKSGDERLLLENEKNEIDNNRSEVKENIYNRENAAAYALKYALSPNQKYSNYESRGGDCTNFVSQCLFAGGVPKDTNGIYKWYWYSDYNRWPSWTSAKELRKYLLNNNKADKKFGIKAIESTFEEMELGDIVQYTKPTHSMIITGFLYDEEYREDTYKRKNDVLISQHSIKGEGWLKDYPLKAKPMEKGRFYIKIQGFYK